MARTCPARRFSYSRLEIPIEKLALILAGLYLAPGKIGMIERLFGLTVAFSLVR